MKRKYYVLYGGNIVNNIRLYISVLIISLIFVIVVLLLSKYFSNRRIVKYIPAITSIFLSAAFFIKGKYFSIGFEDIVYILFSVISIVECIVSLLTAIIVDLIKK